MPDKLYIQPLTLVPSPQAVAGDAIRLAGGMVYAHLFAITVVRDGKVAQRELVTPSGIDWVFERLPEDLAPEAGRQWAGLRTVHAPLQLGERTIRLDQPQVMGILNVTPDSFSDGGKFLDDPAEAQAHAGEMLEAGAAIIDIGGESTRPGAAAVWEGDEIKRAIPAVEHCVAMGAAVSIDTRRPAVMEAALAAGAHVINDVSALRHDPRSLEFAAASGVPVILMHAPGPVDSSGDDLHAGASYGNVAFEVFDWLRAARDRAVAGMQAGVQLLRAHDVYDTVQARNVWRGLRDAALTDFAGLAED